MTRKKSNVKALALAVTCAILAGGYSGLNPVYATADTLYKEGNNVTTSSTASGGSTTNEAIEQLTVGGVTIGGTGTEGGRIIAKNIVGVTNTSETTPSAISINGATFANDGAIKAKGLITDSVNIGGLTISSVTSSSTTSAAIDISGTKFESSGAITATSLKLTDIGDVKNAIEAKAAKTDVATNRADIVALNDKTKDITREENGSTTVDGVNFNGGAVIGVTSINDTQVGGVTLSGGTIEAASGKFKVYNNGAIEAAGGAFKVGSSGTINALGIQTHSNGSVTLNNKLFLNADDASLQDKATGDAVSVSDMAKTKYNTDNITYDAATKTTYINKGTDQQVVIDEKGLKVGKNSSRMNDITGFATSKDLYVGTADADAPTKDNSKFYVDGNDGSLKAADGKFTVNGANGNISTDGSVTAKGGLSAANGNFTVEGTTGNTTVKGTLDVTGAATLGSTLEVNGKATLKDELQVDKKATFGTAVGSQTVINGGDITADGKLTAKSATIGAVGITDTGIVTGVTKLTTKDLVVTGLLNISGDIAAKDISGDSLTVTGAIKGASLDVTGAVTGATINGATITTNSFNGATIGATTFNGVTLTTDGDVSGRNMTASGTIKGNEITDGAGASMKAGTVTGTKITDGTGFTATGGNVTAKDINATTATIAGVGFAANNVSGINNLTATGTIQGATLKVNDSNLLDSNGLTATKAVIDNLTIDGASITSNNADGSVGVAGITVDKTGAITGVKAIDGVVVAGNTASGLTIGSGATAVTIGGNSLALSSTGFNVDDDGDVTGKSFNVNGSNYLDSTGLTTEKAVIGGVNTLNDKGIDTSGKLHVGDQATFGNSTGIHTTINGGTITSTDGTDSTTIGPNKITTKTLDVEDIILRNEMKDGTGATINIKGSDGSMSVAKGAFAVDDKGQVTNHITATGAAAADTIFTTSEAGIDATFKTTSETASSGLKIEHNHAALNASGGATLDLKDKTATIGSGNDSLTTYTSDTIESKVGTNASRTLKADQIVDKVGTTTVTTNSNGTTFGNNTANNTLIYGSAITSTNGGATGVLDGSNLTLTNGTNSTVMNAGGATFNGAAGEKGGKVTTINGGTITTDTLNVDRINLGGEVIDKGAAGVETNSKLYMDAQGNFRAAEGNFTVKGGTGTDRGALHNQVGNTYFDTTETSASMKYNNGTVESNVSVADNSAKISAGTSSGTSFVGSSIEVTNNGITNTGKTTFNGAVDGSVPTSETTIDGNTIKTGHLITDKLTITGSGNADGTGSTPGSIAFGGDGSITSNIKDGNDESTFETKANYIKSEVTDGTTTTKNEVKASGNTNTVTDIASSNNTKSYQTATSIGGVITNGTVELAKAELNKDGFTVKQKDKTDVKIADGDVTVTNNRNTTDPQYANQTVHLSDLGSLNNLDGELTARDEYKNNQTAVGAINAEAGIRREEVARLDNRIDDVNNRVDKVGAMAAAIASLKSIGYDPQAPSEFSIGLGQYKGETGVAMGFFHYPNKNFMINVSLSTAGGETMGGIGATWRFGHKSPQKLLDEQREAQAKKELAAAEKYQAAAKLAKEAQERAEYAAKLARQAQVSADNAKAAADATQAKHFQ